MEGDAGMSPCIIERVPYGCDPRERLEPWQRRNIWRCRYDSLTVEQQLDPGEWPFVKTAVSLLRKDEMTDVRELLK